VADSTKNKLAIPKHVAIIMDGNGRWAKKRLMPRSYGHKKGVDATRKAIAFYARQGVKNLTLFAFSSENWKRPKEEVSTLMSLFISSLKKNTDELHTNGIRIRFIGNRAEFSDSLVQQIEESENKTANNDAMTLNIAANYGGQWDVLQAVNKVISKQQAQNSLSFQVDENDLVSELSMSGAPDPDLFIRTGGEKRISNFLLWQLAYTELFFTDVLWPDFDEGVMQESIDFFTGRERRFGQTSEQIQC